MALFWPKILPVLAAIYSLAISNKFSYVALLSDDSFLLGVRVLGQSLKSVNSTIGLTVMVTQDISTGIADVLARDGYNVRRVERIVSPVEGMQNRRRLDYTTLRCL